MAEPVNHLTRSGYTKALLEELTIEQLAEQAAYWRAKQEEARAAGDERSVWGYGKELSIAALVMDAHD
jgi:hypothetical protein